MTDKTNVRKDSVLVVEDNAANHDVIRSFLNDIDVCCENVFDGMEAITSCSATDSTRFSLILMDINLPHMDGFQTAEKLRAMGISSPIIAVTASGDDELKSGQADAIFDAILRKPFNSTEFFAAIAPYIKNAASCSLNAKAPVKGKDIFSAVDRQVCDVSRGISNMGNSTRLFTKHLNNFKKNNVDLVMRIDALIDKKEYDECAALCHSIKGLSGMLGLTSLYEHIFKMEELIENFSRDSCTREDVACMLSTINNDIRLVCQIPL